MDRQDLSWAVPVMRAGYAGRGLVYLAVAGFSLYAIWYGGQAKGTSSALAQLEKTTLGTVILFLIMLGMLAYAIWRYIDAAYDLEDYGMGGEGTVARIGMVVTGTIHLGLGGVALLLLLTGDGGGEGSSIPRAVETVMAWPGGRWLVGLMGIVTIGAGLYYCKKALKEEYRDALRGNRFTMNYNWALKAGVFAQGVIVALVGGFFAYAGWRGNPEEAGGLEQAFSWLNGQIYGQILVVAICLGLLGFALFCFVNAAYRIVPKVAGGDVVTLGQRLTNQARHIVS